MAIRSIYVYEGTCLWVPAAAAPAQTGRGHPDFKHACSLERRTESAAAIIRLLLLLEAAAAQRRPQHGCKMGATKHTITRSPTCAFWHAALTAVARKRASASPRLGAASSCRQGRQAPGEPRSCVNHASAGARCVLRGARGGRRREGLRQRARQAAAQRGAAHGRRMHRQPLTPPPADAPDA